MANEEQLSILKKGVDVWNQWRKENPKVRIDLTTAELRGFDLANINLSGSKLNGAHLSETNLSRAKLDGANLSLADLRKVKLRGAHLWRAHLGSAHLRKADLSAANLSRAYLNGANLRQANLTGANLKQADLIGVNLIEAYLNTANFNLADLSQANLTGAILKGTDFSEANLIRTNLLDTILIKSNFLKATVFGTIFGNSDLSQAIGLENMVHHGPSFISTDVFTLSKGKIPEAFLRGCGLSDADIEYASLSNPELSNDERDKLLYKIYDFQASRAIQISPLFISYSHGDDQFADKVGNHLTQKGIRYWRDIHDMKAGRLEKQIDRAIRQNPTVLLVLSEHSLSSDWVEHEVRMARGLEKEMRRDMLCPIALDDSWKSSPWPARVMEQIMEYNILDFSAWDDDVKFEGMFRKLIDGLQLFYKG